RRSTKTVTLGSHASMTFLRADGTNHSGRFNDNTLVVRLDLDVSRVLLMGDAEAGGRRPPETAPTFDSPEGQVLAFAPDAIRADVLVVGHHGSKTSSRKAFVDAVSPRIAVISSGPHAYASVVLPDPEIVEEYTHASKLMRTDTDDDACAQSHRKIGTTAD